jgi:hypothetical protein
MLATLPAELLDMIIDQGNKCLLKNIFYSLIIENCQSRGAFSADGLPNLQLLAWGDFSYEGRYSKFNILLCKSDSGYQPLTSSDIMFWSLVQDNMDMLAACPLVDILRKTRYICGNVAKMQ